MGPAKHKRRQNQQHNRFLNKTKKWDSDSEPFPRWKWITLTIIICAIFIGMKMKTGSKLETKQFLQASQVLLVFEKVLEALYNSTVEMDTLEKEDPMLSQLKADLRTIQDRIASLKTQTSQYEKMERIPGGPQHFIKTTLQELEDIAKIQIPAIQSGITQTNEEFASKKMLILYLKKRDDIFYNHKYIIQELLTEGVQLNAGVDEQNLKTQDYNAPETDPLVLVVKSKLSFLRDLFVKRENLYNKVIQMDEVAFRQVVDEEKGYQIPHMVEVALQNLRDSHLEEDKGVWVTEYEALRNLIKKEIEENGDYYKIAELLVQEGVNKLNSLAAGSRVQILPYQELKRQIFSDISALALRVDALAT